MPKRKTRSSSFRVQGPSTGEDSSSKPQQDQDLDLHHSVLDELENPIGNVRGTGEETEEEQQAQNGVSQFSIPFQDKKIICERRGAPTSPAMIFTHGAGGGIADPATADFATGYASVEGRCAVCYQGTMNLTNRVKGFKEVVKWCSEEGEHRGRVQVIGGRSMGARAAVLTALEDWGGEEEEDEAERGKEQIQALILASYPLLAGSKGEKREPERREKILTDLPKGIDVLFIIGSEDAQCDFERLATLRKEMKARSWLVTVQGADHGMALKKKFGDGTRQIRLKTGEVAAQWVGERNRSGLEGEIRWEDEEEKAVFGGWREESTTGRIKTKKRKT